MSDEPVAYLGGQQGEGPPGNDDQVDGYLGGQEGELPALPPAAEQASYSAHDFIQSEEAPAAEADPYADPYAQPAEEAPAQEYEGYDAGEAAQTDASYFDSMGHGGAAEAPPVEAAGYADEDPDQPKTISQQDAESIIKRITTKRILPPEQEKKPAIAPPPRLTSTGGGVKVWPVLFVLLILGGVGVFLFGEQIAEAVPELRDAMFWLPPKEEPRPIDNPIKEDPVAKAKKDLLELVIKSEAKAFGVAPKDVPPLGGAKPAGPTTPGGPTPPGGAPTTTAAPPPASDTASTTPGAPAPGGN